MRHGVASRINSSTQRDVVWNVSFLHHVIQFPDVLGLCLLAGLNDGLIVIIIYRVTVSVGAEQATQALRFKIRTAGGTQSNRNLLAELLALPEAELRNVFQDVSTVSAISVVQQMRSALESATDLKKLLDLVWRLCQAQVNLPEAEILKLLKRLPSSKDQKVAQHINKLIRDIQAQIARSLSRLHM